MSTRSQRNGHKGRLREPKNVPEGFLFIDPDDGFSGFSFIFGCLWLLIWCGVSFPIFAFHLVAFLENPTLSAIFPLLFISIFVIIGIVGLAFGIHWLLVRMRLEPGQVVLKSYPLRLGESSLIRYQRRLRQGYTSRPGIITATWICYEWVQYTQGTDTETRTHTLWEIELPEASVESGTDILEYETQIIAPSDYPPSLELKHNQIRWELGVKVNVPGVPKDSSSFRFRVTPEVIG